ncbi:Putative LOC100879661 [Caligus rogercresseyi]|uniref:LOC100879661 n=1 Tax=Caligus rogercresseyi TaxID=217165 RepID=A0A7T8GSU2_CALRO|nr:Putative LOC100879661 [Caligus rogercresseyi]
MGGYSDGDGFPLTDLNDGVPTSLTDGLLKDIDILLGPHIGRKHYKEEEKKEDN